MIDYFCSNLSERLACMITVRFYLKKSSHIAINTKMENSDNVSRFNQVCLPLCRSCSSALMLDTSWLLPSIFDSSLWPGISVRRRLFLCLQCFCTSVVEQHREQPSVPQYYYLHLFPWFFWRVLRCIGRSLRIPRRDLQYTAIRTFSALVFVYLQRKEGEKKKRNQKQKHETLIFELK